MKELRRCKRCKDTKQMTREEFIVHRHETHGEPIELYLEANPDIDPKEVERLVDLHNKTGKQGIFKENDRKADS